MTALAGEGGKDRHLITRWACHESGRAYQISLPLILDAPRARSYQ